MCNPQKVIRKFQKEIIQSATRSQNFLKIVQPRDTNLGEKYATRIKGAKIAPRWLQTRSLLYWNNKPVYKSLTATGAASVSFSAWASAFVL